MRLTQPTVRGPVSFAASKVYLWNEGSTKRLLLIGNVRVKLQIYDFSAARASVWLEPLRTLADGTVVYQILVDFDRVGAPEAPAGPIQFAGDRLRVPGVVAAEGGITLKADFSEPDRPARASDDGKFLEDSESKAARFLRGLIPGYVEPTPADPSERLPRPAPRVPRLVDSASGVGRQYEANPEPDPSDTAESVLGTGAVAPQRDPIFARQGIFTVAAGNIVAVTGEHGESSAVMATDGVVVQYSDARARTVNGQPRVLEVKAQRAVIFVTPTAPGDVGSLSRDDVLALYLEGDVVATDGTYTMRGPRIYYDVKRNKAVVVDAVFWTYDERRRLPLYVRARAIRQESAEQWSAEGAKFSNTSFFDPEFAIGATSVTITRERLSAAEAQLPAAPGDALANPFAPAGATGDSSAARERTMINARNITLEASNVPFFYWPRYRGDISDVPLRDLRFENSSETGAAIKTRWNIYSLLGLDREPGLSADLLLDAFFERGLGIGSRLAWTTANAAGSLFFYALPSDSGTDVFRSGARREREGEFRGIFLAENRWKVDDHWTIFAEATYLGDSGVSDALFPQLAAERREFTNRLLARRLDENTALFGEASGSFNDFVGNEYLLQSRGYSVSRLPEIWYTRQADDLLPGLKPGLMSYSSEYRASYLALAMDETTAAERGFTSNTLAQRALGINASQTPAEALRAQGLNEDAVTRLDTRHEASLQLQQGPVNIQPFAVARATFYDTNFAGYAPSGGGTGAGNDSTRLWEGGGIRLSTTFQRVYDGVDSRFFDLHRIRHIVEPGVTWFGAGTNTEAKQIPTYDENVEGILDGNITRLGVLQTFQTQRGGPGRWHSVDVLKVNTEIVLSSDDADPRYPIGRWYESRPELSTPGDFFNADATWQVSDTVALSGRTVYDFDLHQPSITSGGALFRHTPQFSSFVDAHFVNSQDSTIISAGAQYELTSKYTLGVFASYDAERNGFQGGAFDIRRRFQSVIVGANVGYDDISGDSSFGFSIQPVGVGGGLQVSGFGASPSSRVGGP